MLVDDRADLRQAAGRGVDLLGNLLEIESHRQIHLLSEMPESGRYGNLRDIHRINYD